MDEEQPKLNNPGTGDSEKVRRFVQEKVLEYFMVRGERQPIKLPAKRVIELAMVADKALFNSASTLVKYMDMDTLDNRLRNFLKHLRDRMKNQGLLHQQQQMNAGSRNQNQQQQQVGSGFGDQNQQLMNSSGNISMIITTFDF